jgi:hypothetical protein
MGGTLSGILLGRFLLLVGIDTLYWLKQNIIQELNMESTKLRLQNYAYFFSWTIRKQLNSGLKVVELQQFPGKHCLCCRVVVTSSLFLYIIKLYL